jgi:hypothetical protein
MVEPVDEPNPDDIIEEEQNPVDDSDDGWREEDDLDDEDLDDFEEEPENPANDPSVDVPV